MLVVAFLLGMAGLLLAVVLRQYEMGMLLAALSLGMIGAFLWIYKAPPRR